MVAKMKKIGFGLSKISVLCFLLSVFLPSPALAVEPDEYEEDDSFYQAKPILVEGEVQTHNFHQEGNEDWVFFEGEAGKTYKVILTTQNVDVEMYYSGDPNDNDEESLSISTRNESDGTLIVTCICPLNGYCFVKVTNKPNTFNDEMMYDIWVNPVNAPNPDARIGGLVYQAGTSPKIPIDKVSLQINVTDYSDSFIRVGYYITPRVFPLGTYTVTAKADGYKEVTKQVTISVAGKSPRCDIGLDIESSQPLIKTFYRDGDGDGLGTNSPPTKLSCIYCGPSGYVENCNDLDDTSTSTTNSTVLTTTTTITTTTTTVALTTTTSSTTTTIVPTTTTTSTTVAPTTTASSTTSTDIPTTTTTSTTVPPTTSTVPTTTTSTTVPSTTSTTVPTTVTTTSTSTTVPTTTTTSTTVPSTTTTSTSTTVPPTTSTTVVPTTTTSSTTSTTVPTTVTTTSTSTTVPTTTTTSTTGLPTNSTTVVPTTTTSSTTSTIVSTTVPTTSTSTTVPTTTTTSTTAPPTTSTTVAPTTTTSSTTSTTIPNPVSLSNAISILKILTGAVICRPDAKTDCELCEVKYCSGSKAESEVKCCSDVKADSEVCEVKPCLTILTGCETEYWLDADGDGKASLNDVIFILEEL